MVTLNCERFVNNLLVQRKLKEARLYYNVVAPRHCKTKGHPYSTFKKFLKHEMVKLYE